MGNVQHLTVNSPGARLASISNDKTLKIFDVENFGKHTIYNMEICILYIL